MKHHLSKNHKLVFPIYLHIDKTPQSVPPVLLKLALQLCVDTADSKMEESRKTFPISQIA